MKPSAYRGGPLNVIVENILLNSFISSCRAIFFTPPVSSAANLFSYLLLPQPFGLSSRRTQIARLEPWTFDQCDKLYPRLVQFRRESMASQAMQLYHMPPVTQPVLCRRHRM